MREPIPVLPQLIARRASETPDRPFLQHVDGQELTFAGLDADARRWAGALSALGVGAGDRVVVMLPPGFDAVRVWVGIAWTGAIEVPLHTAYRSRMLQYTVSHVSPTAAVVHEQFLDRFDEIRDQLDPALTVVAVGDPGAQARYPGSVGAQVALAASTGVAGVAHRGPELHDPSSILYTSGTTGPSKGVIVPWAQAHATATGCIPLDRLGEDDAWYSPYPLFHASGKIPVYAMAIVRGRVVIRDRFDGPSFWPDVNRFGCTATMMIGATAGYIAKQRRETGDTDSPLRHVLVSPPPHDPKAFERELGIRICSVFNMTEISAPISTEWRPMTDRTCGHVRPGYECRIVDEWDMELPDGTPGELIVRSDQPWRLTTGYWDMPEATARAWRNGWFHTGDVCVRREDGEFFFIDRYKDAIRRRGENISSMEVEVVVVEHPQVSECAAYGVPAAGGEEEVMVAVVAVEPERFDPADLIGFLGTRLPRFMIPRYVTVLPALPRTSTEKVKKADLRQTGVTESTWDRRAAGITLA